MAKDHNCYEISVYKGILTKKNVDLNLKRLSFAFPALEPGYFLILADRARANNFTDERLNDAVAHVIDNCNYSKPSLAQIISFDKKIKLFTYKQYLDLCTQYGTFASKNYKPVKIGENPKPVWAHINDIKTYKLQLWESKKRN